MRRRPGARTVWWRQRYESNLLLIAVRTATAIVVSTAAVQFWAIAVKGETPRLTPSIALPPTATAFAAVMPHRPAKPTASKHKPRIRNPHRTRRAHRRTGRALTSSRRPLLLLCPPSPPRPASPTKTRPTPGHGHPRAPSRRPDAQGKAGADTGSGAGTARADTPTGVSTACPGGASSTVDRRLRLGAESAQSCCAARPMLGTWAWTSQHHGAVHGAWTR